MKATLRIVLLGALSFACVSTAAFAVWAYGAAWFSGELAMYSGCFGVFLLLAGLLLRPALRWGGWGTFYAQFTPAFLAYAVLWCVAYFWLRDGLGEWIASFAGSVAFVGVIAALRQGWRAFPMSAAVLFVTHSAGYFAGEHLCYTALHATWSMLVWGTLYGLGFGAGIGFTLGRMRSA